MCRRILIDQKMPFTSPAAHAKGAKTSQEAEYFPKACQTARQKDAIPELCCFKMCQSLQQHICTGHRWSINDIFGRKDIFEGKYETIAARSQTFETSLIPSRKVMVDESYCPLLCRVLVDRGLEMTVQKRSREYHDAKKWLFYVLIACICFCTCFASASVHCLCNNDTALLRKFCSPCMMLAPRSLVRTSRWEPAVKNF